MNKVLAGLKTLCKPRDLELHCFKFIVLFHTRNIKTMSAPKLASGTALVQNSLYTSNVFQHLAKNFSTNDKFLHFY